MKTVVIGTGKLGLDTAAALSEFGQGVLCVDRDEDRAEQLSRGLFPFADSDSNKLLAVAAERRRIHFTSDLRAAVASAETVVLAVDTPRNRDGRTDLREFWIATDMLMYHLPTDARLVIKSEVSFTTCQQFVDRICRMTWREFDVVTNHTAELARDVYQSAWTVFSHSL